MHVVIVRTIGATIDVNSYNCQEIGLAKELVNNGYRVTVIIAGKKSKHMQIKVSANVFVDVYYLQYVGMQSLCIFLGWKFLLKKLNPDIIQIHELEILMSFWVSRYAFKHKIPCVLIQGACQFYPGLIAGLSKKIYNMIFGRYILKHISGIGCKTPTASDYLNSHYLCDTQITPVGLDIHRFADAKYQDWEERLNLKGKKVLLYVGRLENGNGRNPLFLIDVMQYLPDEYCLVLVGEGALRDSLINRAVENGIQNRLRLMGRLPQSSLPALYQSADIFLLPSTYEIYGMVILEAMYFGVPVISTATAGAKALIHSNINGCIIENLDAVLWARKVKEICDGDLNRLQINAKQYIEENMTWNSVVKKYIELYNSALEINESFINK